MKNFIIAFFLVFSSASASADCDFLTGNVFVCYFDSTNGLEIFENAQVGKQEVREDGSLITEITEPVLLDSDLDIQNCISEVFEGEATATCFLNADSLSTARPAPNKLTIMPRAPQRKVIKRIDRR